MEDKTEEGKNVNYILKCIERDRLRIAKKYSKCKKQMENILGRLRMRQREKINYSHCRQFSTFRAGKYNYTQFTTAWEYLISTNIYNERYNINDSMYR